MEVCQQRCSPNSPISSGGGMHARRWPGGLQASQAVLCVAMLAQGLRELSVLPNFLLP